MVPHRFVHRALVVWALVIAPGQAAEAQVPTVTRENEPCTPLTPAQYESLGADHFVKQRTPTWNDYRKYRASIEVIDYNALASTTNPVFTMPRNVTDQDDVYLRLRGNTYGYGYVASWTASDLTRGDVLNVIGASPDKGMFAVQAAQQTIREAGQAAAAADAKTPPAQGAVKQSGEIDRTTFDSVGISPAEYTAMRAGVAALRMDLQNVLSVTVEGRTLPEALAELEVAIDRLGLQFDGVAARAMTNPAADPDFTPLNMALAETESAALRMPGILAMVRANANPLFARMDAEIPRLRATVERMQEAVRAARTRAALDAVPAIDRAESRLELSALLSDVAEAESAKDFLRAQVAELSSNVTRATAALTSARLEMLRFQDTSRRRELCVSVGRFSNQTVKVTITATPVPVATAATPATEGPISRDGTFEADAPTHIHVKIGPVVSWLENPEFRLDTVTADCPAGRQCFMPTAVTAHARQVRAATHVSMLLPGRYFWAESDPGDPHESVSSYRFVPYPTFGFSMTDTAENLFIGSGLDLGRGVGIVGGWHLGRVRRLREEFRADSEKGLKGLAGRRFDRPTGTTVSITDVIDTDWEVGGYLSLSIDAATLLRIFNLGPSSQ